MKYIKLFEQIEDEPKVGDYVKIDSSKFSGLEDFFSNEIGKIKKVELPELKDNGYPYVVFFEKKIPSSMFGLSDYEMSFSMEELLAWSSNLETLQMKIDVKKFNL